MFARVFSAVVSGPTIQPVVVEVESSHTSLPTVSLIGLPQASILESRDRVFSALRSLNLKLPRQRLVISLRPVAVPKSGSSLDLAIALGILMVQKMVPLDNWAAIGELGLDGQLHAGSEYTGLLGSLPPGKCLAPADCANLVLPLNLSSTKLFLANTLPEIYQSLSGTSCLLPFSYRQQPVLPPTPHHYHPECVSRQLLRVLSIALAGGHHLLLFGSPGVGKTYTKHLAEMLLPDETPAQQNERRVQASIWHNQPYSDRRLIAPYHTATLAGLMGGGRMVKPGAVSWAHRGVLFCDELPEFSRSCLEALRQPLEEENITLVRESGAWTLPCLFTLIATANPCPCGYYGEQHCRCQSKEIAKYIQRLSGPVLDRLDLQLRVITTDRTDWSVDQLQQLQRSITRVRRQQEARQKLGLPEFARQYSQEDLVKLGCNFRLPLPPHLIRSWSLRRRLKLWRVAQTLADLAEVKIAMAQIIEAYQLVKPAFGRLRPGN